MRKLAVLGVLAVLLGAGDVLAREVAEGELAARARSAAGRPESARADIDSFPFLGRVAAAGTVRRVEVRVEGAKAGPVPLAAVVVEAHGVAVDRRALLAGDVRVRGIDRGVVAVELDGAALSEVLRLPVTVGGGEVSVDVRGTRVVARAEVGRRGSLVLRVSELPALTLPIVRTPLVPCAVTTVAVDGDRVRLACELDELPAALRR